MNDQDRDLILAYAAGQLSGADAEAASARIASDPELAAEFADQELAMSSLSSIPAVSMTASERAGLRSNLITQLNLDDKWRREILKRKGASEKAQKVSGIMAESEGE